MMRLLLSSPGVGRLHIWNVTQVCWSLFRSFLPAAQGTPSCEWIIGQNLEVNWTLLGCPGGPIFLEFWSPGPKVSLDQNFCDSSLPKKYSMSVSIS